MKFQKTDEFKENMSINPVVDHKFLELPDKFCNPSNDELNAVMKNRNIKTWGRAKGHFQGLDPHWICLAFHKRRDAPLHTDFNYPRYSHHFKIRVDDGIECGGLPEDYPQFPQGEKRKTLKMKRGLWYILDTHSPHQVYTTNDTAIWNLAISIDSHEPLEMQKCLDMCFDYARKGL